MGQGQILKRGPGNFLICNSIDPIKAAAFTGRESLEELSRQLEKKTGAASKREELQLAIARAGGGTGFGKGRYGGSSKNSSPQFESGKSRYGKVSR